MARPSGDNPYQQKSYPILGAGIFLTGIVILSIGLILGFEFPKYVLRQGQLRFCITSPSSRGFEPWLYNRNRTKRNFVYIWNMTNVESFVRRGRKPKFRMIGPYVYDEVEVKVDVGFRYGQVMYRPWTRQFFNGQQTGRYCDNCVEDDRVMTINRALLQEVNVFPSELAYYVSLVPRVVSDERRTSGSDFDVWIARGDAHYKRTVANDPRRSSRSPAVYMRLYEMLGDADVFRSSVLRQPEVQRACDARFNLDDGDDHELVQQRQHSRECGLGYSLLRLRSSVQLMSTKAVTNWTRLGASLSHLICRHTYTNDSSERCFLDDASENLTRSYVQALVAYVTDYLPSVLRTFIRLDDTQLVSDVSVRQFVTGYLAERFDDLKAVDRESTLTRVKGILEHEDTEEATIRQSSKRITLRTCLFNRSQTENLFYDEIDEFGSCETSGEESSCSTRIGGVQDYEIPPTRTLMPCHQPEVFSSEVQFYIPEMWQSAIYSDFGPATHEGVRLREFRVADAADMNRTSTSHFTGYLSWVEMTDDILLRSQSVAKSNRILVEPVSGYVWCRTANFQFHVGLKWAFQFHGLLNRSQLNVPFQSHALHVEIEPSEESRDFYNAEVRALLRASCIGLIGLSIVGILVAAFGVCVAFALIRRPSNRVAPQFYVNPHLPPMETQHDGFGGNTVILY